MQVKISLGDELQVSFLVLPVNKIIGEIVSANSSASVFFLHIRIGSILEMDSNSDATSTSILLFLCLSSCRNKCTYISLAVLAI